jgi:hypothetical protein
MSCKIKPGGQPVIVKAVVVKPEAPSLSGSGVSAPVITAVPKPSG